MQNTKILRNGLISLIVLVIIFFAISNGYGVKDTLLNEYEDTIEVSDLVKQIQYVNELVEKQENIDKEIEKELSTGIYTPESPLIVVNPYGRSPLTAYIGFNTDFETKISVKIVGKSEDTSYNHSFSEFTKSHIIPILGLYSDTLNEVIVYVRDSQDQILHENRVLIQTDKLDAELAMNIFNVYKTTVQLQNEVNFSYDSGSNIGYKTAFDSNGEYRWYLDHSIYKTSYLASFVPNDSLYYPIENILINSDYFGRIKSAYYLPLNAHHDLELLDESIIVASQNNVPNTVEDYVFSLDLRTGEVTETIDYKEILIRTRQNDLFYNNVDWMHLNSIYLYEDDLIVSSNWQGTIIRNDWNGNIKWMLSDPTGYPVKYQEYLLKPIGDNFQYPYNQHAVEVIEFDNDLSTLEIIAFDNGSSRFFVDKELQRKILNNDIVSLNLYSRMVVYQIDESNMTVKQLFEYGSHRPELFSKYRGDADILENGNLLGTFNQEYESGSASTVYIEINRIGSVVWEVWATSSNQQNQYQDYRLERKKIYNTETKEVILNVKPKIYLSQDIIDYNDRKVGK